MTQATTALAHRQAQRQAVVRPSRQDVHARACTSTALTMDHRTGKVELIGYYDEGPPDGGAEVSRSAEVNLSGGRVEPGDSASARSAGAIVNAAPRRQEGGEWGASLRLGTVQPAAPEEEGEVAGQGDRGHRDGAIEPERDRDNNHSAEAVTKSS